MMTTFKHANQLVQLKKIAPAAAVKVELAYKHGLWGWAGKAAADALKAKLESSAQTFADKLWIWLNSMIDQGHITATFGQVKLVRRKDDYICLYAKGEMSKPVAMFARDWNNQSSAYAGKWTLIDNCAAYNQGEARRRFDEWYRSVTR